MYNKWSLVNIKREFWDNKTSSILKSIIHQPVFWAPSDNSVSIVFHSM